MKCSVVFIDFFFTCTVIPTSIFIIYKSLYLPSSLYFFFNKHPFQGTSELSRISLQKLKKFFPRLYLDLYNEITAHRHGGVNLWNIYLINKDSYGSVSSAHQCISQNRTDFAAVTNNPQFQDLKTTKLYFSFTLHCYCRSTEGSVPMSSLWNQADRASNIQNLAGHHGREKDRCGQFHTSS